MFLSSTSAWLLNTSRDGDSTTCLGSLYQCLTTHLGKKVFLISSLKLPQCHLRPFPLILLLVTWEIQFTRKVYDRILLHNRHENYADVILDMWIPRCGRTRTIKSCWGTTLSYHRKHKPLQQFLWMLFQSSFHSFLKMKVRALWLSWWCKYFII